MGIRPTHSHLGLLLGRYPMWRCSLIYKLLLFAGEAPLYDSTSIPQVFHKLVTTILFRQDISYRIVPGKHSKRRREPSDIMGQGRVV